MGMGGGGGIGGIASLAGAGLSAYGDIIKGEGEQAAYTYQSQVEARAANVSKVQGIQSLGQDTQKINQALGQIDTVRAASHDDPTSPTGASIRDTTEYLGNMQKTIDFDYYFNEEQIHEANSKYLLAAGEYAKKASQIGAAGSLLSGLGGLL